MRNLINWDLIILAHLFRGCGHDQQGSWRVWWALPLHLGSGAVRKLQQTVPSQQFPREVDYQALAAAISRLLWFRKLAWGAASRQITDVSADVEYLRGWRSVRGAVRRAPTGC